MDECEGDNRCDAPVPSQRGCPIMPKVSEFYGLRIYFYFADHPPPHFHVFYAENEAQVAIESLELLAG